MIMTMIDDRHDAANWIDRRTTKTCRLTTYRRTKSMNSINAAIMHHSEYPLWVVQLYNHCKQKKKIRKLVSS